MAESLSILLVEDNPGDVVLIREALSESGMECNLYVVSNGGEALEFIDSCGCRPAWARPDLVLLDLNLPRCSGRDVLRRLKDDSDLRSIPVVVMTSSPIEEDIYTAYALKANGYIVKPMDYLELKNALSAMERYWFCIVRGRES